MTDEIENIAPVEENAAESAMDSVAKAFDQVENKESGNDSKPEAPKKAETESKVRDESGKFTKKTDKEAPEIKAAKEQPQEAQPVAVQAPSSTPPEGLAAPFKAKWGELSSEWQNEIRRREEDGHKALTQRGEEINYARQFKEIVTPYLPMIQAEGATPQAAIQNLLNTAYILRTATPQQKGQLFANMARQFGVDLGSISQIASQNPSPQSPVQPMPDVRGMVQKEITAIQQQQEQAHAASAIKAFSDDPKNVHYNTVKPEMAALLNAGRAQGLQDAYDKACWANPDVRPLIIAEQSKSDETKRTAEIKAKADAARKAASSIVGSPSRAASLNGKKSTTSNQTAFDSVREAFGQIEGGVN